MAAWLLRACVLAVVHAAVQVALDAVVAYTPTDMSLVRPIVLALLIGVAVLWGALDGWQRRPDSGRTWFIASLVAGPLSGILAVIGRATLVDQTGINQLGSALTGGAAFVALLILLPAGLGMLVGGRLEAPADVAAPESTGRDDSTEDIPANPRARDTQRERARKSKGMTST